ncbi:MAG: thioredoxin family protein, partial [Pyrinomonadaceae bacterium]
MRFNRPSKLYSWLFVGSVAVTLYFLNVEMQSYLGRQAIEKTGLASLSFEEASLRSRSEGKLILADVSAIWCSSCRRLDRQVFANSEVKRVIEKRFIFARIEYESEEGVRFVERYDVGSFPT